MATPLHRGLMNSMFVIEVFGEHDDFIKTKSLALIYLLPIRTMNLVG